jgi:general secretion pathway protein F
VRTLEWLPGVRSVLGNLHRANFAEMLALLVEHRVPLPTAFPLAAEATGAQAVLKETRQIAESLAQGRALADSLPASRAFPPLMRWMISTGERQGTLAAALRHATDVYRRRAEYQAEWMRLTLPIALMILLGGGVTLIYALSLFLPLSELLRSLGMDY